MPAIIPIPLPGLLIRGASYLFGSVLRKYYTRQKLSELIEVKVSSEPAGITVNCSELPDASAWIIITNLSPFHVTVYEFEAELYLPERAVKFVKICNVDIGPSDNERLFVQTDLTVKQIEYIKRHKNVETLWLKVKAMLSCRLSTFEINDRNINITQKNIEFMNCDDS